MFFQNMKRKIVKKMPCAIIENINTNMSLLSDLYFNLVGYYYF